MFQFQSTSKEIDINFEVAVEGETLTLDFFGKLQRHLFGVEIAFFSVFVCFQYGFRVVFLVFL